MLNVKTRSALQYIGGSDVWFVVSFYVKIGKNVNTKIIKKPTKNALLPLIIQIHMRWYMFQHLLPEIPEGGVVWSAFESSKYSNINFQNCHLSLDSSILSVGLIMMMHECCITGDALQLLTSFRYMLIWCHE